MRDRVLVTLGRYGDIVNALPIAWDMARESGEPTRFAASRQFWDILEGCSYVHPVVWDVDYSRLGYALQQFARTNPRAKAVAAQCYGHHADHARLTDSYQKESWRIAGYLSKFGTLPTVFDNRNRAREDDLLARAVLADPRPLCLVGVVGVSSPFQNGPELLKRLKIALPGVNVVDLHSVKGERIYDLLGLYDRAKLLISIDTVHLHLARASSIPTVAILNNGWFGSVPPQTTIKSFRYAGLNLDDVVSVAKNHFHASSS